MHIGHHITTSTRAGIRARPQWSFTFPFYNQMQNTSPSNAELIAEQFKIEALEPRLEMLSKYGRDNEQPYPDGHSASNPY